MRARQKIAGVIFLAACAAGRAQIAAFQPTGPEVWVQVRMETTGEASIQVWPDSKGRKLAQGAAEALHCNGAMNVDPDGPGTIRCSNALSRDGLLLEGVVNLAPIAERLNPSDRIELLLNFPRLGLESLSVPMEDLGGEARISRRARFSAGDLPPPIQIRFGYRPDQLAAIYLSLLALALALALVVAVLSRAGLAGLSRSILVLGMILWMGAASALHLEALVRILLFSSPRASLTVLFVEFWPPLFCVAAGVAIGSREQTPWKPIKKFWEVFGGFAVIPLVFTCAIGVLPSMMANDWIAVAPWLAAAPLLVLARRQWIRKITGASVRQLNAGELKERILAMAARVGRPKMKIYIAYSARSQPSAAFTLPGKSIYLTAALVRSLSKREVDAVVAHELSHAGAPGRGLWTALVIAMILFEFPLREILLPGAVGFCVATLIPLAVFFVSLRNARRHEFAADAGAVALCGDPRAMIASLAKVSRNNNTPLEWNALVECLAPHPSTHKRILALAAAGRIDAPELAALCSSNDPGEHYELPQETAGVRVTDNTPTAPAPRS
ncbi:MAG: M48 family metalloprotease [Terracidiphilus sp.]|jgi:Zn-dependent protease with chaperone function